MKIGGLQRCSLIDYPGEISGIVFTMGCNFRCPYCYNSELVIPERYPPAVPQKEVLRFLEKRRGKLDAVVVTGGEPCMQEDLAEFFRRLKMMEYKVKLDTNGSFPNVLEDVLPLADYVSLDIKAPLDRYSEAAGKEVPSEIIEKSIGLLMNSGRDYEFRTTVFGGGFSDEDFEKIGKAIKGAKKHFIQNFLHSGKVMSPGLESCTDEELERFRAVISNFADECAVR